MGLVRIDNKSADLYQLSFEGEINEKFQWLDLSQEEALNKILVNLDKATAINSLGILHWMRWWNQLLKERSISEIIFLNAKPFFLNCSAIVKGFLPEGSSIQSFFVEYGDDSGESELRHYTIEKNRKGDVIEIPEKIKINRNNQEVELDISSLPQTVFRALNVQVKLV